MAQPSPFKSEEEKETFQLFTAIEYNFLPEINKILDREIITPDAVNDKNITALMFAVIKDSRPEVISLLLDRGADINKKGRLGGTALMVAATKPYKSTLQELIKRGANLDIQDNLGRTALMFAVREHEIISENVEILCKAGANPNIFDNRGFTALHYTAIDDHTNSIYPLIRIGHMDVNILSKPPEPIENDTFGPVTPLCLAANDVRSKYALLVLLRDFDADPNIPDQDDKRTPLMILMNAIYYILEDKIRSVKALLEFGARLDLKDIHGKTAVDYANEIKKAEERKAILDIIDPEHEKRSLVPWKGLTQADIGLFDAFFEDTENYSCCPVCLGFVQRSEACRYMSHNCKKTPGVIPHEALYDLYKNDEDKIFWCTICGRVCDHHRHYELSSYQSKELPNLAEQKYNENTLGLYGGEKECIADGGGGLAEKVKRFERMIAYAKELQTEVGKIGEKEARKELVEESWNAPMVRRRNIPKILEKKKWTTNISTFPKSSGDNIKNNTKNIVYPDIPKLPGEEKPIFNPSGHNNIYGGDDVPTLQFIHDNKGVINRHEDSKISIEALIDFIRVQTREFGDPKFGYCFDYPRCEGRIYPQDIAPYWEAGDASNADNAAFEKYHREFNKKFSAEVQRGGYEGFMVNIGDSVQCVTKRKGGARKTRRNRKARKHTRRLARR